MIYTPQVGRLLPVDVGDRELHDPDLDDQYLGCQGCIALQRRARNTLRVVE
ncbi:hypothetical protein [Nocardioides panacisoli]